jgi:hypothetical protein
MTGGKGHDVFVVSQAGPPVVMTSEITDLSNQDTLDLRNACDGVIEIVHAFHHQAGEATLTYDAGTDRTSLAIDSDGDAVGDVTVLMWGDQTGFSNFIL